MVTTSLPTTNLTLADWSRTLDPNGKTAQIVELLSQCNEILDDAVFCEGNQATGTRITIRTGLPAVYYRSINQGVPSSKSTSVSVDESCGLLEARSYIDRLVADLNGNTAAFRLSEDIAFLEAMNQSMAQMLMYGNPANDQRQFLGFAPRYSSLTSGNGQNILNAGGTGGNCTSIYLVGWGDNTVFCPFPKGSKAGISHEDDGLGDVPDANGNLYKAYKTLYQWQNGLAVKDWRYVVRIANINVLDLVNQSSTQSSSAATAIINLMSRAIDRIPFMGKCKPAFYANRTIYSMLRIAALNKSANALSIEEGLTQFGTPTSMTKFLGIPLRKVDQILNTESAII